MLLHWPYRFTIIIFKDVTDTDYDFPASSEDVHEWEEYDEPQPVMPFTRETRESPEAGTDIDYDDPVHRYS